MSFILRKQERIVIYISGERDRSLKEEDIMELNESRRVINSTRVDRTAELK
jgi:hypothetical protein